VFDDSKKNPKQVIVERIKNKNNGFYKLNIEFIESNYIKNISLVSTNTKFWHGRLGHLGT
jgi:hypothetical protein